MPYSREYRLKRAKQINQKKFEGMQKAKICREEIVTIKGRPVKVTVYAQKTSDYMSNEEFKSLLEELAEDYEPPSNS